MTTPIRHSLLAAATLAVGVSAAAAPAASAKYRECEFTKELAKRYHAPRCKNDLGRSRWIVVSGGWKETLTVHDSTDGATFDGKGTANLLALGLNGNSAFPSKRHPVRSLVSARPEGIEEWGASSKGGWTTKSRFYDCGLTAPDWAKPTGFGGIFMLAGKSVKVQWILGAAGFGCNSGPYPTPSPRFPDPVAKYSLKRFRDTRIVRLPIRFAFKDDRGSFHARVTYKGIARLRRYR